MFDSEGSKRSRKFPCPLPSCGSSDAFAVYEDGWGHCFSCKGRSFLPDNYPELWNQSGWGDDQVNYKNNNNNMYNYKDPTELSIKQWEEAKEGFPIRARNISEETAKRLGIRLVVSGSSVIKHLYPVYNREDTLIGYKERDVATKNFSMRWMSSPEPVQLHGQRLFKPGGKKIIIVEGELDLAASLDMLKKSPYHQNTAVVSIISGVDSAIKSFKLKENFQFVDSFSEIVLCLDNDEAGEKARDDLATIFNPKKLFIANDVGLFKDPNQALMDGEEEAFINAISFPVEYKPKGVSSALDLMDRALNPTITESYKYPWKELNKKTFGARKGELVAWLARTGVGKTSIFENIQYHWLIQYPELKIANISLEKNPDETLRALVGLKVGKLLNHPEILPKIVDMNLENEYKLLFGSTEEEQNFYLYDGWGSISTDDLLSTIRYYVNVLECDFVFFDHISLAVSDQRNFDERKSLDEITTKLAELTMESGCGLHVISHMNDEGQARGSRNIDNICWVRIDLDRDKDAEEDSIRNVTGLSVRKNRPIGATGPAGFIEWQPHTGGHMVDCEEPVIPKEKDRITKFEEGL